MNGKDRECCDRLYDALRKVGSLVPANPADIARLSLAVNRIKLATPSLMNAVFNMKISEHAEAMEDLDDAERKLSP